MGDDLLALDHRSGQVGRYIFSFGRKETILDKPDSSSIVDGAISSSSIKQHRRTIDTSTFRLVSTLNTHIKGEELVLRPSGRDKPGLMGVNLGKMDWGWPTGSRGARSLLKIGPTSIRIAILFPYLDAHWAGLVPARWPWLTSSPLMIQ